MTDRVLVTGAGGFIAKCCIIELLRQGYSVRGTVRTNRSRSAVGKVVREAGFGAEAVEFAEADLNSATGWNEAADDCRYVLHVASPFPSKEPRDAEQLIKPAREGTRRVLKAAAAAGVEHVVVTSSVVAIMRSDKPDHIPRTEDDWTDASNTSLAAYARSKTLAERAAWEEIAEIQTQSPMFLSTVNPGLVLGPALDGDLSTSHYLLRLLGRGTYPMLPDLALPVVDVRDVAKQHVLQLQSPQAAMKRWLCSDTTLSMRRICELLAEELPDLRRRIPKRVLPSGLVRLGAIFDRNLLAILPELGRANLCDNSRSVEVLGMSYIPADEAVRAAARSLRNLGII